MNHEESVQIREERLQPIGLHPWFHPVRRMQRKPCRVTEGRQTGWRERGKGIPAKGPFPFEIVNFKQYCMEQKKLFFKRWQALWLLPLIGLMAGCHPWGIGDGDIYTIYTIDKEFDRHNQSCYLQEMPYETHIGANKFGCYVDGELAASQGEFQEGAYENQYVMGVMGRVSVSWAKAALGLSFDTEHAAFIFEDESVPFVGTNSFRVKVTMKQEDASGVVEDALVEITYFDDASRIVSGRFGPVDVPLHDADGHLLRTVRLTDGRFDVKIF